MGIKKSPKLGLNSATKFASKPGGVGELVEADKEVLSVSHENFNGTSPEKITSSQDPALDILIDWHLPDSKDEIEDPGQFETILQRLKHKQHKKELKKLARDKKFVKKRDLSNIKIKNLSDPKAEAILADITEDLQRKGLWREESQEVIFTEEFPREQTDDIDKLSYEPMHRIDFSGHDFDMDDPEHDGNEIGEGLDFGDAISDFPKLCQPPIHNIMRRNPWNLDGQITRTITENGFFENFPQYRDLLPAACFHSKGIFDEDIFLEVRFDAYFGGTFHLIDGKKFLFEEYCADLERLKPLIDFYIKEFWVDLPHLRRVTTRHLAAIGIFSRVAVEERLDSFWDRFRDAYDSLTTKQKKAVELIYMDASALTYREASKQLRISIDSFQDRVRGAVKKLRETFPELLLLPKTLTSRQAYQIESYSGGLFDKLKGQKYHKLFRVNSATGTKTEIDFPSGGPTLRDISPNEVEIIRARVIEKVPVPDFFEADYFCGLFPERYFDRIKGISLFKGHGPSYQKMHTKRGVRQGDEPEEESEVTSVTHRAERNEVTKSSGLPLAGAP